MRIAVLSDATMPTPTPASHGLGRVVHTVAEGLLSRGHDVVLFCKVGSTFSGAMVMPSDAHGYEGERAIARECLKLHKEFAFDCVIDHGHLHYLSRMLPDLPICNVYHDRYQPYSRCPILLSYGQQALMPSLFDNARIIPNSLNPADYQPRFEPSDPPYALFIGAVSELKQPFLAIEACARMGLKLIMAGQPILGKVPITEFSNAEYVGMVSGSHKADLYRHAKVMLQLGTGEAFGLTTLEAGLYGTPVAAWAMGGSLDLVKQGLNGAFVPMMGSDKVQDVCDAVERAMLVPRHVCRAYAESLCDMERQLDLYEDALSAVTRGEWW